MQCKHLWKKVAAATEADRLSEQGEKRGIFIGAYALNPFNQRAVPIYLADYVLMGYGTGAIMAVPGEDQRDWDFAKEHDLPIIPTVQRPDDWEGHAFTGDGPAINSEWLDGLFKEEAIQRAMEWLEENGLRRKDHQLSSARLGCEPTAVLGMPDSGHLLPAMRRGAGSGRPVAGCASRRRDVYGGPVTHKGRPGMA